MLIIIGARSSIEVFNINGNRIGGIGLQSLCRGLAINTKLDKLLLADNMIDQVLPRPR